MDVLTVEIVRDLLSYDPDTGVWRWLKPRRVDMRPGDVAGCKAHKSGYGQIGIKGKLYLTHRLAWLYMTGEWPEHEVDHINGVPGDDRWGNLRTATASQNRHNVKCHRDSTTGVRGVRQPAGRGSYLASIYCEGKNLHIGSFKTLEAAASAREAAELKYFGEFSSLKREGIVDSCNSH